MSQDLGYDVIGDVHGHADKLRALLIKMGYVERGGTFLAPQGRQAVFVGDLIDRGPQQMEVLHIVRRMIDAGQARAAMGNHEFNAIGYVTPRPQAPGEFLRKHSATNVAQHTEFLRQVGEGSGLHRELVEWFRTLPPVLDLGGIRVVHAWWHEPHVDLVQSHWPAGTQLSDEFLHAAYAKGSAEWQAMEGLTKGLEIRLPDGHSFFDHGGVERFDVRARWWLDAAESYRAVAIVDDGQRVRVPDLPLPADYAATPIEGTPVFIGHYWMSGAPMLQSAKVACVDYSAAKDGPLVAYRWDGEDVLCADHFWVS